MFLRLIYVVVFIVNMQTSYSTESYTFNSDELQEFMALRKAMRPGSQNGRYSLPNQSCIEKLSLVQSPPYSLYDQGINHLYNRNFFPALDYLIMYLSDDKFSLDDICNVDNVFYNQLTFNSPENDNLVKNLRNLPFVLNSHKNKSQQHYENFFINLPIIIKSNLNSDHVDNFKRLHSIMIIHMLITNNKAGIDRQSPLARCIYDFVDENYDEIISVLNKYNDATLLKLEVTSRNWQ